jgi:two-component system, OmpR family, sensor kinase
VNHVVAEAIAAAIAAAQVTDHQHTFAIDEASPPVDAWVDPDALRQVIDNMLANVGWHTPPGSTATISVRSDIDVNVVTVTADGPGTTSAVRQRAFDWFWRADAARARPGGSGLGHTIVHGLVDANHGQIRLDATVPGGLLTKIRLPVAAPEYPPLPA